MKKLLLTLLFIPFLLGGCHKSGSSVPVSEEHTINVPVNEVTLTEGEQYQVPIEVIKKSIIICRSNNEEVATITHDGLITAVKEGETTVSISAGQDNFIVFVTVLPKTAEDSLQIVMVKNDFVMQVDDTFVLPISVKYGNVEVSNPTLSYVFEEENIVSINNLTVTALKEGTTKCVVTASYEQLEASEIFTITVYQ